MFTKVARVQTQLTSILGSYNIFRPSPLTPCGVAFQPSAKVLVYGPSNVPLTGPSIFFQNLPANLDCQDLGLCGIHCSSVKDSDGIVYTHGDPFASELSDMMATEVLIQRHLEDILNNNRQAVTRALQTELKDALKAQKLRKQSQQRMRSAAKVILSSSISIVSSSSNMNFRNACLNSMKVRDTHDLSASLHESLRRVTSWKFAPRCRCPSAQVEEESEGEDATGREI
ncbi:Type 2 DNA topoisomerase 6 subunit B-like [Dissostichus eleginoides]|uniref:Type 2 DNA topoisomerase 6 subunit B-like n=1 Tax=Dissostichus eleginoides TaxID=100907 RepID=A0AAD9FIW3_DISEL|nr:Type 2 DNA topoisomerase 6 subunit B-like [Dissostichus eleginoides]